MDPWGAAVSWVGGTAALPIEKGQGHWRGHRAAVLVVSVHWFYSTLYSSLIHTYLIVHRVVQHANIPRLFWKYDWCWISTKEIVHPYRGTQTFSQKNVMLRLFLVVFSLCKYYTESYIRLSLLLAKPPHNKIVQPTPKKHLCFSSVLFIAQPTQSNHVKRQAQQYGFDVPSHPTPGTSVEGVDQERCGWILTNTANRF